MAKDEYFRIVYIILKALSEAKRLGQKISMKDIGPEALEINQSYWIDILYDLSDEGYIKGIEIYKSITGRIVNDINNIRITMKGEEYLKENTIMKKIYNTLKDIKDLIQ